MWCLLGSFYLSYLFFLSSFELQASTAQGTYYLIRHLVGVVDRI